VNFFTARFRESRRLRAARTQREKAAGVSRGG